ncbi:MAG: rhodanese-like domain-containing protein [Gallionella sp.]|nr:rhodanese-like domain-containing protein [Gallionella sp.]
MLRLLFACLILISATSARAEIIDIDNAELAALSTSGVPVIDVRTAPEWEESGIVPGSRLLTYFDERGNANPAAWLEKVKGFAKQADPVIVICRSGNRTKAVSQLLSQQAGYAKVYNVKHGIRGWIKENRPIVPAAPALASCRKSNTC